MSAASAMVLSAFIIPLQADAQFLKKLSKELKKLNDGIEKVDQLKKDAKKKLGLDKSTEENTPKQAGNAPASGSSDAVAGESKTPRKKASYNWRDKVPTPYLTPQTRFLHKKVNYDHLPQVSEGIFYIQEYNRSIGYAAYFGFWTVDGRCLFPAIYESFTKEYPRFDSGACVVKATGTKRHSPVILYADGTTRSLSHEWADMTQFHNGVAMVRETRDMRTNNLFYINTKGEKIWPHLAENNTRSGIVVVMRPLSDGLRAYYSNPDRAWGYLNPDGSIAIPPQFAEVRDFANGYALVFIKTSSGTKPVFIDKQGKTVVEVPANLTTMQYASHVSDISDGYFLINARGDNPATFYNLQGEAVKSYPAASGFADGTAFVLNEKYGEQVYTINRDFDIVGWWPFKTTHAGFPGDEIKFNTVPYYTYDLAITINTAGDPVMYVPHGVFSNDRLGQFSPDGYASAQSEFADPADPDRKLLYKGYVDTEGRYRVVFSDEPEAGGPFDGNLPGPWPINPPLPPGPLPPFPLPPVDTIPIGPTGGGEASVCYRVNVTASPAEGGSVFGSGEYAYGDTVRVTGTPAEGYRISYIECSRPWSVTDTFNKFTVRGDMDITCYFTKKDTTETIGNGIMEGKLPEYGLPVYLQLGASSENKYAEPTQGFLAIMVDDATPFTASSDKASASINIFFVPMNVRGLQHEGNKRYMRLDGGIMKYSNFSFSDDTGWGIINNPLLSLMIAFDGADQGELMPGSYRVEIAEGSPEEGHMKLGSMQRFSAKHGWISADDASFQQPLGGFFIKRVDKGLGADFLKGLELKNAGKRAIQWEPGEQFYGGNPSSMAKFAAALGEMFRKAVAGTPLSDYDMQQFSSDLDNHLFKMKP